MQGDEIVCLLKSDKIDLNAFVYRKVKLKGLMIKVKGWDIPILEVEEAQKSRGKVGFSSMSIHSSLSKKVQVKPIEMF